MTPRSALASRVAACAVMVVVGASGVAAGADAPTASQSIVPLAAPDLRWTLRLPKEDKVLFRGVVSFDAAGVGNLNMLYPAPNVAVGLIAVLTHGLMVEATKKAQKDKLQDAADQVLLPYRTVLDDYTYRELMQRALERMATGGTRNLVEFSQQPGTEWFVESSPVFALSQDQSALIVDNAVSIYAPNAAPAATYQSTVRVVSSAKDATDLLLFWTADQGRNIKGESALLLAESLDIALRAAVNGASRDPEIYKTVRYREGGIEKMERGLLIDERCNRIIIKTLRGGLMSVPSGKAAAADAVTQPCEHSSGGVANVNSGRSLNQDIPGQ